MGYAILRIEKLKGSGDVARMTRHALREVEDVETTIPNARADAPKPRVPYGGKTLGAVMSRLKQALDESPVTTRKDAPRALDIMLTTSHEDISSWPKPKQLEWLKKATEWAIERFGGRTNVLTCTVHMDESTPHVQLIMMPRDAKGIFAASRITGNRIRMQEMQTAYWETVGKPYGLLRGEIRSQAVHTTIQSFYGALEAGEGKVPKLVPVPEEPSMLDRMKPDYQERKQARIDALAHNAAAQKRREELAKVGASMHPKTIKKHAEKYRADLAKLDAREAELAKRETALSINESKLKAEAVRIAQKIDQWSKTMTPGAVEKLAKDLGLQLKPGRGMLDQIRKGGLANNMLDAAAVFEKAVDPDGAGLRAVIDAIEDPPKPPKPS